MDAASLVGVVDVVLPVHSRTRKEAAACCLLIVDAMYGRGCLSLYSVVTCTYSHPNASAIGGRPGELSQRIVCMWASLHMKS